jgi:hypothetical protein
MKAEMSKKRLLAILPMCPKQSLARGGLFLRGVLRGNEPALNDRRFMFGRTPLRVRDAFRQRPNPIPS